MKMKKSIVLDFYLILNSEKIHIGKKLSDFWIALKNKNKVYVIFNTQTSDSLKHTLPNDFVFPPQVCAVFSHKDLNIEQELLLQPVRCTPVQFHARLLEAVIFIQQPNSTLN